MSENLLSSSFYSSEQEQVNRVKVANLGSGKIPKPSARALGQ